MASGISSFSSVLFDSSYRSSQSSSTRSSQKLAHTSSRARFWPREVPSLRAAPFTFALALPPAPFAEPLTDFSSLLRCVPRWRDLEIFMFSSFIFSNRETGTHSSHLSEWHALNGTERASGMAETSGKEKECQ